MSLRGFSHLNDSVIAQGGDEDAPGPPALLQPNLEVAPQRSQQRVLLQAAGLCWHSTQFSSWFCIPQPPPIPTSLRDAKSLHPAGPRCPQMSQKVPVPCPQVPCTRSRCQPCTRAAFPAPISGMNADKQTKNSCPSCPGHCRGGGCSVGGLTSVWGCSGDAGELLRRSPLHGAKDGQGGHFSGSLLG